MHLYTIRPGHSFRMPDGSLKTGGDQIELATDVAVTHAGSVDRCEPPDEQAPLPVLTDFA